MVLIEKFELSQHIASCGLMVTPNHALKDGCTGSITDPMGNQQPNLFYNIPNTQCSATGEQYCYAGDHNGTIGLFSS